MPHADRAWRPPAAGKVKHRGTKPSVNREGRPPPERNASAQPMQIPSGRGGGAIPLKKPLPGVSEGAFYLACHRKWLMLFP